MASITAASLTLRSTKGSPLTNAEVDANFTALNTAVATGQTAASYTAADVLAKLITVDGSGSGLDADLLDGLTTASANTVSTVVVRDASGNFAAGTISAALSGNATTATDLQATLAVLKGGTGSTTTAGARTNLGLVIGTDIQAYDPELAALASVTSAGDSLPYFTGVGTATTTSFPAYGRSVAACGSAGVARSVLGLVLGTDVQPFASNLSAVSALSTNGIIIRTGAGTAATRTLVAGTDITITNLDGVSGDINISSTAAAIAGTGVTIVGKTVSIGQPVATTSNVTFNNINAAAITATTMTAGSFQTSSDIRLKKRIETLNGALDVVNKLRGVSYIKDGKKEIGVIAQEVELLVPEVIGETADGFKTVSYSNLVSLLIEAIKEQNTNIKQLTSRLEKLEN